VFWPPVYWVNLLPVGNPDLLLNDTAVLNTPGGSLFLQSV